MLCCEDDVMGGAVISALSYAEGAGSLEGNTCAFSVEMVAFNSFKYFCQQF